MAEHIVSILDITPVTHDVKRFTLQKPAGYTFVPGQATDVAINLPGWEDQLRPFTFTALNEWDYPGIHHQDIRRPSSSQRDPPAGQAESPATASSCTTYGAPSSTKGEGVFIAGGAGITFCIAIFRQLHKEGKAWQQQTHLFQQNPGRHHPGDANSRAMLGQNFINTLTDEAFPGYDHHRMDEVYLRDKVKDYRQHFYICGPDAMVAALQPIIHKLGGESIIVEL